MGYQGLDDSVISKLLNLSQLSLESFERDRLIHDLERIIEFVDVMATVPTDGIAPLSHPLDLQQPLREDLVFADTDRARSLATAPVAREGLYVVPRVVAPQ